MKLTIALSQKCLMRQNRSNCPWKRGNSKVPPCVQEKSGIHPLPQALARRHTAKAVGCTLQAGRVKRRQRAGGARLPEKRRAPHAELIPSVWTSTSGVPCGAAPIARCFGGECLATLCELRALSDEQFDTLNSWP